LVQVAKQANPVVFNTPSAPFATTVAIEQCLQALHDCLGTFGRRVEQTEIGTARKSFT
jgi:hypothetical protein